MISGLEITEITIRPAQEPKGPLRGFVKVILNDALALNGIRVVAGKFGLFVAFPREYNKEKGTGHNICYPIHRDLHEYISAEVLREFRAVAGEG